MKVILILFILLFSLQSHCQRVNTRDASDPSSETKYNNGATGSVTSTVKLKLPVGEVFPARSVAWKEIECAASDKFAPVQE